MALPRIYCAGIYFRETLLGCLIVLPTLNLAALHHPAALLCPGRADALRARRTPFHLVSHTIMTISFVRSGALPDMKACLKDRAAIEFLALFQLSHVGYTVLAALPYPQALFLQLFAAAGPLYVVLDMCKLGLNCLRRRSFTRRRRRPCRRPRRRCCSCPRRWW